MDRVNNLDKIQFSLKKLIKLVRDNSKVVFLTPAILGGLWQLYSLYKIDPAYLRFFSTSQLITDGVIILILLVCISVIVTIYYVVIDFMHGLIGKIEDNLKGIKKHLSILSIYYLGLIIVLGLPLSFFYSIGMQLFDVYSLLIILITPIIAIIILHLYLGNFIFRKKGENKKIDKDVTKGEKFSSISIFFISYFFSILISVYEIFNSEFRFPSNLINIAYIECDIKKGHPLLKNIKFHKIEYYNDKYIFVSIITENRKKIKVYDFKDLLKQPDCALSKK